MSLLLIVCSWFHCIDTVGQTFQCLNSITTVFMATFGRWLTNLSKGKVKVKKVNLYSASRQSVSKAQAVPPLPSQPQLVLIYWPWRDGRLSRHWCKVAPAEIRTCSLPIANPVLYRYQTATGAPSKPRMWPWNGCLYVCAFQHCQQQYSQ